MIFFGYLILAHMLGDFIFQPGSLIAWKVRSKAGLAVHALIHFAVTLLLFSPFFIFGNYDNLLIATAFGVSMLHFCIDATKIHYEFRHNKKVRSFIVDQIAHLLAIIAAFFILINLMGDFKISYYTFFPDTLFYQLYTNIFLIIFLALIIFTTLGIEMYRFQHERERDKNARLQLNYRKIITRFLLTCLLYVLFIALLLMVEDYSHYYIDAEINSA